MKYLTEGDTEAKKKADSEKKKLYMQSMIETQLAPKIAMSALGDAVEKTDQKIATIAADKMKQMKKDLAAKI